MKDAIPSSKPHAVRSTPESSGGLRQCQQPHGPVHAYKGLSDEDESGSGTSDEREDVARHGRRYWIGGVVRLFPPCVLPRLSRGHCARLAQRRGSGAMPEVRAVRVLLCLVPPAAMPHGGFRGAWQRKPMNLGEERPLGALAGALWRAE